MKLFRYLSLVSIAFSAAAVCANAQPGVDAFFGVTTMSAPSSNLIPGVVGDYTTPRLAGTFGKAGADVLFTPHFGINGETDFRFSQGAYAGLTYRPTMYDFNGVWRPFGNRFRRVAPEFQSGLGGVNVKFYYPSSTCDALVGCSSNNQFVESANHFQVHLAAGVNFYATKHLFVRPQIDAHWINNFSQFGSDWVPEYGAALGWSFGAR